MFPFSILKGDVQGAVTQKWEAAESQLCFGRRSNSQHQELLTQLTSQGQEEFHKQS